MDRISSLSNQLLATALSKDEPDASSKYSDKHGMTPQIIEEIERLKIVRKKYQSLEDTERCMTEWKEKGSLDLQNFEMFVLGEVSAHSRRYLEFMKGDPDYSLTDIEKADKDEQRRLTNLLLFKLIRRFPISLKEYKENQWELTTLFLLTGLTQRSVSTKVGIQFFLYGKSILTLGTEKLSNTWREPST